MEPFEELLKRALERKEPPPGFTGRVLARTKEPQPGKTHRWFAAPFWFAPVMAALLGLAVSLGYGRYHERQEGERARAQLVAALRLTGAKLDQVRTRVVEIGTGKGTER